MKNRGFTLVELLAVIILLALIVVLIFPSVNNIISRSKETTHMQQINTILNAAYDWSLKNSGYLPELNEKVFVTISELKLQGLIDEDLKDPNTKEDFPNHLAVSIKNVGTNYKYSNEYSKKQGNYLYTVELDLLSSEEYEVNKPSILLTNLTQNSDGNYITEIDINRTYEEGIVEATSSNNINLTNKVTKNIIFNDKAVEKIDTSKIGIYNIYYTVVDDNGYSSSVVRKIIIVDNELPVLVVPENITIGVDTTTIDLKDGAICTDNSGDCEITTSGYIDFGVVGKYIIQYSASDSSGNTTTQKRVITIE